MKRNRSVEEKTKSINFKCNECNYSSKSRWALKTHKNHKHTEPTSPNEKKPKMSSVVEKDILPEEVVKDILSEVFHSITKEEETENKNKTTIEPSKDFLTNTALTLAEMLDNVADQLEEEHDDDVDMEELEDRLDILRGDKPRNKIVVDDNLENTLVTLPLKDVEELRRKIRSLEELNEELTHKLKELELKKKTREPKKNKKHTREEFIVIEMETNEEEDNIEQLIRCKENGYSRSNPQSEPLKKKEIQIFDCPGCDKKFNKREHMMSHQKNHEVSCLMCDKLFKNSSELQEHSNIDHNDMICHSQCEGGRCTRGEARSPLMESPHKCNFCGKVFPSKNTLSTNKAYVHRTEI